MRANRFVTGSWLVLCTASLASLASATTAPSDLTATLRADIDAMYPDIEKLYIDLHQHPELSLLEVKPPPSSPRACESSDTP